MTTTQNIVTFGVVNGVTISGNVPAGTYGLDSKRTVTLGSNAYLRSPPNDWPRADAGAPVATSLLAFPKTIPGGTVLTLYYAEAAALITAGAAS